MINASTKKAASAAAALVLAGALFGASATAAQAADYPVAPVVKVKVTAPAKSVKVGKKYTVKGTSVKGAKVTITYGKTAKTATKKGDSVTLKKTGKFTTDFKIKTTGKWIVKVTVKAAGKKTYTKTYTVTVKK